MAAAFAGTAAGAGLVANAQVSGNCVYTFATPLQRLLTTAPRGDVIGQSYLATPSAAPAFTHAYVNVYVHTITDGTWQPSQPMLDAQIRVLDEAYADAGFSFTIVSEDIVVNAAWSAMTAGSQEETDAKGALHHGGYWDLNLYLVEPADGSRGWATFPQGSKGGKGKAARTAADRVTQDGVVLLYSTLPGGSAMPYDLGDTATHEVGHWLGLYHTYENGCSGKGDLVDDTPAEATANLGCPAGADTCPRDPGSDPIHNFMDATDDACMFEFTAGQAARMQAIWTTYRLVAS